MYDVYRQGLYFGTKRPVKYRYLSRICREFSLIAPLHSEKDHENFDIYRGYQEIQSSLGLQGSPTYCPPSPTFPIQTSFKTIIIISLFIYNMQIIVCLKRLSIRKYFRKTNPFDYHFVLQSVFVCDIQQVFCHILLLPNPPLPSLRALVAGFKGACVNGKLPGRKRLIAGRAGFDCGFRDCG